MGRFKPVFTAEQEKELADHIRELDVRFYGLRVRDVRSLAYQFAEVNHISHRFDTEKKMAGKHWVQAFAARNSLSVRSPEKCSLARTIGFNKIQCDRFFQNLKSVYSKSNAPAHRVFNMDETGLSTVPNKLPKVYASKGKKTVSKVVSAEKGQLVTAVCCMSASGIWVPPGLIFARKRMKDELFYGAPVGTLKMISDTEYMNSELFVTWLRHFCEFVKPTKADPVVLILDNHVSHCSLEAILFAREHSIILLTLPPHGSHKIQPLDRGFFFPLKSAFANECDKWMVNNAGKAITMKEMAALFHAAYSKVATIQICEKSFACTGLYPYNPDVFTEHDFAPAEVTNKPNIEAAPEMGSTESNNNQDATTTDEEDNLPLSTFASKNRQNVAENSGYKSPTPTTSLDATSLDAPGPSSVTPKMILPFPSAKHEQTRKRKSKKSEILSSTPYKDQLLEEQAKKKPTAGVRNVFKSTAEKRDTKKKKLIIRMIRQFALDATNISALQIGCSVKVARNGGMKTAPVTREAVNFVVTYAVYNFFINS